MADGLLQVEGGHPLADEITAREVKNLVPKMMVATLLGSTPSVLRNVPFIRDVDVVSGLLSLYGVGIDYDQREGILQLNLSKVESARVTDIDAHADSSRISILFCGLPLHRLGEAFIPDLDGRRIDDRSIDFHLEILCQFGAAVGKRAQSTRLTVPHGFKRTVIEFPCPLVGATERALPIAVCAHGSTELCNAAVEPEIMDLIGVPQKMSAIISANTDHTIHVEGVDEPYGYTCSVLSDRTEAASWASAALATREDVPVRGAHQSHITTFLDTFHKVGGIFDVTDESIHFYRPGGDLKSTVVETNIYPGSVTGWQQLPVVALTQAQGLSIVHGTAHENRFDFTDALCKMGTAIQVYRKCLGGTECRFGQCNFYHSAVISGPTSLTDADIIVPDLCDGFSHLIAALTAESTSRVEGVNLIDRGHEHFMSKPESFNAAVTRLA